MKKLSAKLALVLLVCALMMAITGCESFLGIGGNGGDTPHTHQYSEEITKTPTCTEAGVKTFKCECGDSYTEAVEKLPHTEKTLPAVAPTCTETGLTEGKQCSVCETVLVVQDIIPAKGHKNENKDHKCDLCDATLSECADEDKNHKCDLCDATLSECADDNKDHKCDYCGETVSTCVGGEVVVENKVDATCTADGSHDEVVYCTACGEEVSRKTIVDAKLNHKAADEWVTENVVDATCESKGSYDSVLYCSKCGEVLDSKTVETDVLGHTDEVVAGKAATCTETGLTEGKKCSVCGTTTVTQEEIPALGHKEGKPVVENSTAASCGAAGSYDEVVYCTVCGKELSRTNHTVDATPHSYKETITTKPTCTEAGVKTFNCSVCGDTYTEELTALGHDEIKHEAKAPTCTQIGWDAYVTCSKCDYTTYNELAKAKHNYNAVVTEPTCTKGGYTTHTCSACGSVYESDEVAARGHNEEGTVEHVDATCTKTGVVGGTYCTRCDEGKAKAEEVIPALDHNTEGTVEHIDATCTETGVVGGTYCTACGEGKEAVEAIIPTLAHSYPDTWEKDETKHWRDCAVCGADGDVGDHDAYNATCFCGYTCEYRVVNGNFEKGLDGWTLNNIFGEAPFAGIDEKTTFWGEAYPMFNVGKYFSSYADGASEQSKGTLASSYFVVNSGYATYMLGGAGNHNVYITIENKNGEVLALYRNTKFADLPAGEYTVEEKRAMIGNTVFLANFVTYKVSLADFAGQEIRFVIHDYASEGWGVVYFDELNTYYTSEDAIPENAILAENLLANKDALNAEIALEVTEQGDYTLDSYNAYLEKLAAAKALVGDIAVTQATVNEAVAALTEARLALTVRPVEEVEGVNKSFRLTSGNGKEIVLTDYININGLGNITYAVHANNAVVTLSSIVDGKFTITAGEVSEATNVTVSIIVYYNGTEKLVVELSVQITNDVAPSVFNDEVGKELDIFDLTNKTDITLDLSENVDNAGNLALTYSVNGKVINGSDYTFTFGTYTEQVTYEILTITVSYTANGEEQSISYTYKLAMKDTTANRLANGGFENGMEGWTVVGNIGNVSTDTHYWTNENGGYAFGMDGTGMFSAYAPGALESAVGTLTSSTFKVRGCGFVTFKVGAMKDGNYVYVDVVDAETKQILARYYNGLWAENTDGIKSGCTLIAYKADLSAFIGKEVFFRISDNADSGYGLFFADSFITYYENEPEGFNAATPVNYQISGTIYDVFNGGFEMGDVQGWWNNGEPGAVTGADAFFSGVSYGKDGNFLYSGVEDHGAGNGREGNTGVLTSSVFEIGGSGYITYMLGGGNAFCYVQVIDSTTGEILARYRQQAREDAVLKLYVADLRAYIGRTVRVQVVDNATYDWGCVSFDNVVTYYESKPNGMDAVDVKYEIVNGSFESGKSAWKQNGDNLGEVINNEINEGWYTKNDDNKDGEYLFSFAFFNAEGGVANVEGGKGNIESSNFVLKQDSYVSFRFGGAGGAQNHDVYIQLCRADGSVIATFYNDAEGKVNTRMNAYYYQYQGEDADCFFRVVDNSVSDYGCFVVDDFRVNLESAPEGFIAAIQ